MESVYGIIEVKTNISSQNALLGAVDQTLEVKRLCRSFRPPGQKLPFTGVFVFESNVAGDTLFNALKDRVPQERVDFVLILKPAGALSENSSFHFAHWQYHRRGDGTVRFATADETADDIANDPSSRDKFLTFGETESALVWFYLFLIEQLESMKLSKPNLWQYAHAAGLELGWRANE